MIRFVATSAICFLRNNTFLGYNILFCMERYKCSVHDIITGNGNHIVNQYCKSLVDDDQLLHCNFKRSRLERQIERLNATDNARVLAFCWTRHSVLFRERCRSNAERGDVQMLNA